jgi:hypothetical protein
LLRAFSGLSLGSIPGLVADPRAAVQGRKGCANGLQFHAKVISKAGQNLLELIAISLHDGGNKSSPALPGSTTIQGRNTCDIL